MTFADLDRATRDLQPPFAVVDTGAFHRNAADMTRRAGGKPIRLASKSIRCRALTRAALAVPGYRGVLAYTLPEAMWLAEDVDDVLVAYPTTDTDALWRLAGSGLADRVTIMIDDPAQLDLVPSGAPIRVCLDLDASLRLLGAHLGTRRSPVRDGAGARALAREVVARPGLRLVGVMSYEAQIAGLGDRARPVVRLIQALSRRELRQRRAEAVAAVAEVAPLEFVNGGGTGSLESTAAEDAVTELAAGSGLYGPALFDTYRAFRPEPAAFFALPVTRVPAPGMVTVLGGGWVASGTPGRDRLPTPVWPEGLKLTAMEGAGEVQTPLTGARGLRVGDRVWFRHTKAGELCERVNELHLVDGGEIRDVVPTYRGEGRAFL
ncbi:alanine racemase [Actinorhabdospora filicis]|uniref:Alanine racemase n=1 Tax=Actinorhabdospora filicis TaxID=1785913 RepID=A0A9W6ST89_9ACTN|nr:amino acid deaminase/aldolase [Actinorhabdospora filicis]GLZ81540.1 alanine racemase [Actinorhabdospora filicis]